MRQRGLIGLVFCTLLLTLYDLPAGDSLMVMQNVQSGLSVIFQDEMSPQASESLADLSLILSCYREELAAAHTGSWPVFIDPSFDSPNGFVSFAYQSSHWSVIPHTGLSLGSRWHELLAVHEGRHMIQFEALDRGFSHAAGLVGGPYLRASIDASAVPSWMFEGDAVAAETRFTDLGRGRIAGFSDQFLQLLSQRHDISWAEIANGSYIHQYPNHYVYGYYMMGDILNRFGSEGNAELFSHMGRYPLPLIAPTLALSSLGGGYLSPGRLFAQVRDGLSERTSENLSSRVVSPRSLVYQPDSRGYAAITASALRAQMLVTIEHDYSRGVTLNHTDLSSGDSTWEAFPSTRVTFTEDSILWYEDRPGLLQSDAGYMSLSVCDLSGDGKRDLVYGLFLGTPAFSPVDQRYAAVVCEDPGSSRIIVVDSEGVSERSIASDELFFSDVVFGSDGRVYAAADDRRGRLIVRADEDGSFEMLADLGLSSLQDMNIEGDDLLFSSDMSGTQEIYALSLEDGSLRQLTVSGSGVSMPFTDTAGGLYCIGSETWDRAAVYRIHPMDLPAERSGGTVYLDQQYLDALDLSADTAAFGSAHYQRLGALYPYSWGLYPGAEGSEPYLGISWIEPLLDLELGVRAGYRFDEKESVILGYGSYAGSLFDHRLQAELDFSSLDDGVSWEVFGGIGQQQDWSKYGITVINSWQAGGAVSQASSYPVYLQFSDLFRYGRQGGYRSLFTLKPGFDVSTGAWMFPGTTPAHAYQVYLTGYAGGLGYDDGLALSAGLSWRSFSGASALFDDTTARGYDRQELYGSDVSVRTLYSSSLRYRFPISYPDLPVFSLGKLLRLRGELYAGMSKGSVGQRSSVGCRFISELNLFQRYQASLPLGIDLTYRLHDERLLLSILVFDAEIRIGDES